MSFNNNNKKDLLLIKKRCVDGTNSNKNILLLLLLLYNTEHYIVYVDMTTDKWLIGKDMEGNFWFNPDTPIWKERDKSWKTCQDI
jgi:hypothetical protein